MNFNLARHHQRIANKVRRQVSDDTPGLLINYGDTSERDTHPLCVVTILSAVSH